MTDDIDPDDNLSRWESILADADIKSVPVNFLKEIQIKMMDGTEESFDIADLRERGFSVTEIEELLDEFMSQYDDDIDSLDFVLNVEALAQDVWSKTKRLLG